ncbi:MAG TPA: adenylate/guanylate cyclase domain-containing protein [Dongiaceae bacterium]|nr:adenylate/guanylate cyclase domain-containing protein [Dongiaceae bacterium]
MTRVIAPENRPAKRYVRLPIWLVLVMALGGMTSVMALVIGVGFYFFGFTGTRELVQELGETSLAQLSETVDSQLQPAYDQARFLADLLSRDQVDPNDNQRLGDVLLGSMAAVRQLRAVAYVGMDERLVWAGAKSDGRGYDVQSATIAGDTQILDILERVRQSGLPFWSEPVQFNWSDGPLLIAVAPVFRDAEPTGFIGAAVSMRAASARMERVAGDTELVAFVLTAEGRVLMHGDVAAKVPPGRRWADDAILPTRMEFPDPVLAAMPWPPPFTRLSGERSAGSNDFGVEPISLPDGNALIAYRQQRGYNAKPWIVGYHLPETRLDRSFAAINQAIPFALAVLLVALGLAYWLGRSIAKPMTILSQAGQRLARLDFTPLEIKSSRIREVERAVEAQRAMRNGLQWLSNYIPRTLTPLLMKSGDQLISRERDIVVLFTDIVGFSTIAEGRPAAKLAALLNRHFGLLGAIIEQEGGTIDKYIGDSIMAFWGAPLDQEDMADRAVRSAQRIAQKMHVDNERRARKGLRPLRIRIGIHKGPALVGNIGAPGRVNYTLVGDTVNVAQRLEQFGRQVDGGSEDAIIVISETLARALPPGLALIDCGEHVFHGRTTAMRVFRVPMV